MLARTSTEHLICTVLGGRRRPSCERKSRDVPALRAVAWKELSTKGDVDMFVMAQFPERARDQGARTLSRLEFWTMFVPVESGAGMHCAGGDDTGFVGFGDGFGDCEVEGSVSWNEDGAAGWMGSGVEVVVELRDPVSSGASASALSALTPHFPNAGMQPLPTSHQYPLLSVTLSTYRNVFPSRHSIRTTSSKLRNQLQYTCIRSFRHSCHQERLLCLLLLPSWEYSRHIRSGIRLRSEHCLSRRSSIASSSCQTCCLCRSDRSTRRSRRWC